eukprot:3569756-Rhodomonas_salina.1
MGFSCWRRLTEEDLELVQPSLAVLQLTAAADTDTEEETDKDATKFASAVCEWVSLLEQEILMRRSTPMLQVLEPEEAAAAAQKEAAAAKGYEGAATRMRAAREAVVTAHMEVEAAAQSARECVASARLLATRADLALRAPLACACEVLALRPGVQACLGSAGVADSAAQAALEHLCTRDPTAAIDRLVLGDDAAGAAPARVDKGVSASTDDGVLTVEVAEEATRSPRQVQKTQVAVGMSRGQQDVGVQAAESGAPSGRCLSQHLLYPAVWTELCVDGRTCRECAKRLDPVLVSSLTNQLASVGDLGSDNPGVVQSGLSLQFLHACGQLEYWSWTASLGTDASKALLPETHTSVTAWGKCVAQILTTPPPEFAFAFQKHIEFLKDQRRELETPNLASFLVKIMTAAAETPDKAEALDEVVQALKRLAQLPSAVLLLFELAGLAGKVIEPGLSRVDDLETLLAQTSSAGSDAATAQKQLRAALLDVDSAWWAHENRSEHHERMAELFHNDIDVLSSLPETARAAALGSGVGEKRLSEEAVEEIGALAQDVSCGDRIQRLAFVPSCLHAVLGEERMALAGDVEKETFLLEKLPLGEVAAR